jgi:hypothetical protein
MRKPLFLLGLLFSINVFAATPQEILKQYEAQAKQENSAFVGFSADRGAIFFHSEHTHSDGKKSVAQPAIRLTHITQEKRVPTKSLNLWHQV